MADVDTPRTGGSETKILPSTLRYLRESLIGKAEGLDEESARWSPVASGTSILWLIDHFINASSDYRVVRQRLLQRVARDEWWNLTLTEESVHEPDLLHECYVIDQPQDRSSAGHR